MTGEKYLQILVPEITNLMQAPEGYEIDPTKVKSSDKLEENTARLIQACENFLDMIIFTAEQCPVPFRVRQKPTTTDRPKH